MKRRPHKDYSKIISDRNFALAVLGFCLGYFIIYVVVVITASLLISGVLDWVRIL